MGKSRSQLIAEAVSTYVGLHDAAAVTQQLNAVYGDTADSSADVALSRAQARVLRDEGW